LRLEIGPAGPLEAKDSAEFGIVGTMVKFSPAISSRPANVGYPHALTLRELEVGCLFDQGSVVSRGADQTVRYTPNVFLTEEAFALAVDPGVETIDHANADREQKDQREDDPTSLLSSGHGRGRWARRRGLKSRTVKLVHAIPFLA
jgi:hypothetical protein